MNKHPHSIAVVGIQLGDEGKGRVVDNKIQELLSKKEVNKVYVVRSQGGSNAGHTVESAGKRIGLHQLPSGIFYDEVVEILDSGMVIHAGDLLTEISLVEELLGKNISSRIILSSDAMLCTDLERAKESLNKMLSGKAKGGTGRGIGPTTAEFYEKTGFSVKDLLSDNWQDQFSSKYEFFEKMFSSIGESLSNTLVPDFEKTKKTGKSYDRKLGGKKEFIDRLTTQRKEFIDRDIVQDTFYLHPKIYADHTVGVIFEMAQAVGLDPWFGTRPDRTSTPTTPFGILVGTRFWKPSMISEIYGVMKATYMSSVGARTMPTESSGNWAEWVREIAHEYGTTTGRPRDICHLDLEFLKYNLHVSDISGIVLTHLDISRSDSPIKVCTSYKTDGEKVPYKPDMNLFSEMVPQYEEFPSWGVEQVAGARKVKDLPTEAMDFIAYLEQSTNLPVIAATTGPERQDIIWF